jgi:glycosyltransferase involved in cell wall biosynthesis
VATDTSQDASQSIDVLHVIPSLGVGGAELMLSSLVRAPRRDDWKQAVVYFLKDEELVPMIRVAGVPVHRIGIRGIASSPIAVVRLALLIRRLRPKVVQGWLYYGDLLALFGLLLSNRRRQTRLYWGIRCSDMRLRQYGRPLRVALKLCSVLSSFPDGVIANSFAGLVEHLRMGYRPRISGVIGNCVNTTQFRPDGNVRARLRVELGVGEDENVVVHVARVDPMKDHSSLISLASAMPDVKFVAVGRNTESLCGPPNLLRLGQRRDVHELLAAADFFVSTSLFGEGSSNAIAEAMAAALPVIVTDVGDVRRVVGDAGVIVPPGNYNILASKLQDLLEFSPVERRALGLKARQQASKFSQAAMVRGFDAVHGTGRFVSEKSLPTEMRLISNPERSVG